MAPTKKTDPIPGSAPVEVPFQILALSGGGYRGLFTATVLKKLEEDMGDRRIGQCFDLICGTSIGGIIAMGLGLEIPAAIIASTIENRGADIFKDKRSRLMQHLHKRWTLFDFLHYLNTARYRNLELQNAVREIFGEKCLGDSKHRLLIPAINYTTGKPQMFKTRHHADFVRDHKLPMLEVAMATSAAPTYFPIWQNKNRETYLDGGLVANAPGLLGVHEAMHFLGQNQRNIRLLSIGTIGEDVRFEEITNLDRGIKWWGKRIFSVTIAAQEGLSGHMLRHMLDPNYHHIDVPPLAEGSEILGLDKTGKKATALLISHASKISQDFIGNPQIREMLRHQPPPFIPVE